MAESELLSKKRGRSSASYSAASRGHSLTGILTRSKSQMYLHRHRSGRARADSFRFSKLNPSPVVFPSKSKRPRLGRREGDWDGVDSPVTDGWSCNILIKDLRARRVLSLPSAAPANGRLPVVGDDGEAKGEGSKKGRDEILEVEALGSDSLINKIQNCFGDVGPLGNEGDGSTGLDEVQMNEKSSWGDCEIPNGVGDLDEECLQATPPEAEILDRVYRNENETAGSVLKQNPFVGSNERSQNLQDIPDRNQIVARRRCRVKIFKSPGSLSYKRLLPYLTDIGKDDSCLLERDRVNMKSEKVMTNKSIPDGFYENGHNEDSKTSTPGAPGLASASHSVTDASSLPAESASDSPVPCRLLKSIGMRPSFVDNHCSKPVVNQGHKFVRSLNSCCISSMGCHCLNKHNNDSGQVGEGCSEGIDARNLNDTRYISPLTLEKYQPGNDDESCQHSGDATQSPTEGHIRALQPCKAINSNIFITNLRDSEVSRGKCVAEKQCDNYDAIDLLDAERLRATPSDADMCAKPEAYETVNKGNKYATESHQVLGKPLNVDTCMIDSHSSFKRTRSSSGRKLGLSPCSQMKLFKTPNSFSYRRLLPYLMGITKDNSVEESSEENAPSKLSTSELHESPSEKHNGQNFYLDDEGKDSHALRMAISPDANIASKVQQPCSSYPGHNSGTPVSFGSQEQHRYQVVKVTTEKDRQLKPTPVMGTPINRSSLLIGDSSISMPDDLTGNCKADSTASLTNPTRPANPVEADILCTTSQIEVFDPLKVYDNGSGRSILKRNPRGCRGICTCLNCASFRLHAERAFEFSKNQMEDAEEVALDLVKELSHLRNVVVKFASNPDGSGVFSNDQVNEACKKAAEAEQLAKDRLVHMKDDLNIHCRITCGQRPKVRFANEVDERIIS